MVMADGSKGVRGRSERAKSSKSVRLDDRQGFDHKFNKTGFKCEAQSDLYYYFVKCYEQVLRGNDATSVLSKRDFVKYRVLAQKHRLKPLPDGFRSFEEAKKIETLSKLFEEQVDAGMPIVQGCEVNHLGKMEVDEGSSAELGPQYSINEVPTLDGDALQSVARNFQGDPQGRPPTCFSYLYQCLSELELLASSDSDALMKVDKWAHQGVQLLMNLKDRGICNSLGVDSTSTLSRSRQKEILAQPQEDIMVKDPPNQCGKPLMEGVGLQRSYCQANNFGKDVEHGAEIFASIPTHVKQELAIGPFSTASSSSMLPVRVISEGLNVTPSSTGRLRANLKEIPPQVAGNLQDQFSKPTIEALWSHPQANYRGGNQQIYGGESSTTLFHSGGSSASQMSFSMGDSIPTEPPTFEQTTPDVLLNEQGALESFGHLLSPPQANEPWSNQQIYGGESSTTVFHFGGSSASQMSFSMGDSIPTERPTLEQTTPDVLLNEQGALEGSSIPRWSNFWSSPVRYE